MPASVCCRYACSESDVIRVIADLRSANPPVVGFDLEWHVLYIKDAAPRPTALIQLCYQDTTMLPRVPDVLATSAATATVAAAAAPALVPAPAPAPAPTAQTAGNRHATAAVETAALAAAGGTALAVGSVQPGLVGCGPGSCTAADTSMGGAGCGGQRVSHRDSAGSGRSNGSTGSRDSGSSSIADQSVLPHAGLAGQLVLLQSGYREGASVVCVLLHVAHCGMPQALRDFLGAQHPVKVRWLQASFLKLYAGGSSSSLHSACKPRFFIT